LKTISPKHAVDKEDSTPMSRNLSRRDLLQQSAAFGAVAVFGAAACGKEAPKLLVCSDTTGLTPSELMIRTALAYVEPSPQPEKVCSRCQQFIPTAPDACGTCKVLKGPVNPGGSCKSFVAKPA
jgi:hypothetical protein